MFGENQRRGRIRRYVLSSVGLICGLVLAGCAQFGEQHYSDAFDEATGEVVSFYRLEVSGHARLSSARYLSGICDERALDLFFNDIRTGQNNNFKLFVDQPRSPELTRSLNRCHRTFASVQQPQNLSISQQRKLSDPVDLQFRKLSERG